MNIVKISGTVGQQMFQYAFAMSLLHHGCPDLLIDASPKDWIGTMFPLRYRKLASPRDTRPFVNKNLKDRLVNALSGTHPLGSYREPDNSYKPDLLGNSTAAYFDGSWLSYRYFDAFAAELAQEFTVPEHLLNESSQNCIKEFRATESVAVTVHRPRSKENTCTRDYYNWAITHIRQFVENPRFTVFTDDADWVAANLLLDDSNATVIGTPAQAHHAIIPVCSRAKHNITANTPESWWAAWLNPDPDKIVIAPQLWSKSAPTPDLCPRHWITIPVT